MKLETCGNDKSEVTDTKAIDSNVSTVAQRVIKQMTIVVQQEAKIVWWEKLF